MLILGILALIQTVFLPGFIFVHVFRLKTTGIIQKCLYVFALSLFSNYAFITLLVLLKLYTREVVFLLISFEFIVVIFLVTKNQILISGATGFDQLFYFIRDLIKQNTFSIKVLFWASLIIILFYFSLFVSNLGTIFYFVDTVNNIHWNTWAMDFAHNIFPQRSSHFPQLIPANWSISYLLIGESNVHFFPKSFMPLFFFGNLLMFLDLAFDKKNYVYLIALIIYGLFAPIVYNLVFIADGNGDLPVSFFTFLSFYAYLKTNKEVFNLKEYTIVFLFASTAAGTKLAGFYIFSFLSIICLYHLIKNYNQLSKKQLSFLAISIILILSINLFWYLLKPTTMAGGLHQPEWLAKGYANILKSALHLLYYNWGLPVLAFFILTFVFSLFYKESRYITLFFVVPPIILWMFKYSSDFRNLSFVVPFISYASAFGVLKIIEILKNRKLIIRINQESLTKIVFNKKINWIFASFIPIGFVCFFLIGTNYFYQILFSIYSFISKYYFQSNRITYLIDYTFFLPVDYYQRVFAVMSILVSIISALYFIKIKVRDVFIVLTFSALFLNFTFVTKSEILNHQKNEFAQVNARNYYQTISTILNKPEFGKIVITNFKAICTEKIPRKIEFKFIDDLTLFNNLNSTNYSKSIILFVHLKNFDSSRQMIIRNKIIAEKFQVLFVDGDFILTLPHKY